MPIVASLSAQRQLLQVIEIVSTAVLLPFAFVLRILPWTREFGNMLIALFFGLYIVVPTMYAMSGAAFLGVVTNPATHTETVTITPPPPLPPITTVQPIYTFQDFAMQKNSGATPMQNEILYRLGSTIPQAIFIPNFMLVVLVTCIMSLSKALHSIQA